MNITIDKEGNWFYNGHPIVNRYIYLFFNQHLQPDAEGGYCLHIEDETCPVIVEDAPFVVIDVSLISRPEPPESFFTIRLNDETEEHLVLDSLQVGNDNVLYCSVKGGKFRARFSRPGYYRLAQHILQEGDDERFFIPLNGKNYYIKFLLEPLTS